MVFDHKVKYDGVLYLAGEEVPMEKEEIQMDLFTDTTPVIEKAEPTPKRRGRQPRKE